MEKLGLCLISFFDFLSFDRNFGEHDMLTLPRLFLVTFFIGGGVLVSSQTGRFFGTLGYCVGFFFGVFVTFCLFLLFVQLFRGFVVLFFPCPTCRRGSCRSYGDYVWRVGSFYGYEKWRVWRFKCRCDDQYIFDGIILKEVLPNGTTKPYKKLVGFRKWRDVE